MACAPASLTNARGGTMHSLCSVPVEGRAADSRACPHACPLSPAVPRSPRIRPPAWLRALIAHVDVLRCPVRGATPGVVACTHKRGNAPIAVFCHC